MSVKAIMSECSYPYWVEVALRLVNRCGWEVCYWVAIPEIEKEVKLRFPKAVFHSNFDAIRGICPKVCSDLQPAAIDQDFLRELSFCESITLNMLSRMDSGNAFSYAERIRLYHKLLAHWKAVLDFFCPDVVVFATTPHMVYDYVVYRLCKKMGIRTIVFESCLGDLVYSTESFEQSKPEIISRYRERLVGSKLSDIKLSKATEGYIKKILSDYSEGAPYYVKRLAQKVSARKTMMQKLRKILSFHRYPHFFRRAFELTFMPAPPNYMKKKRKKFEESFMTGWEYIWTNRFKASFKKWRLRRCYTKLTQGVNLDTPFVYVPLHYQPECSTSPKGEVFAIQLLMVQLLSKCLPAGWQLYVKEHMFQYSPLWQGERARDSSFYDDLAAISNVKLVPLHMNSFELIDASKAVATITGMVGWEAIVRSKPVLVFGHAWYRDCEGVFYMPSDKRCKEVLTLISSGYQVDHRKTRLFMQVLEEVCFRGNVGIPCYEAEGVSDEQNVESLTEELAKVSLSGAAKYGSEERFFWRTGSSAQVS